MARYTTLNRQIYDFPVPKKKKIAKDHYRIYSDLFDGISENQFYTRYYSDSGFYHKIAEYSASGTMFCYVSFRVFKVDDQNYRVRMELAKLQGNAYNQFSSITTGFLYWEFTRLKLLHPRKNIYSTFYCETPASYYSLTRFNRSNVYPREAVVTPLGIKEKMRAFGRDLEDGIVFDEVDESDGVGVVRAGIHVKDEAYIQKWKEKNEPAIQYICRKVEYSNQDAQSSRAPIAYMGWKLSNSITAPLRIFAHNVRKTLCAPSGSSCFFRCRRHDQDATENDKAPAPGPS